MQLNLLILLIFVGLSFSCSNDRKEKHTYSGYDLAAANSNLTEVIVADIFNPPFASRIYAYSHLAAYETLTACDTALGPYALRNKLNGLRAFTFEVPQKPVIAEVAAIHAFYKTAKKLVWSEAKIASFDSSFLASCKLRHSQEEMKNSIAYGEKMSTLILKWAKQDGFIETRKMTRYTLTNKPGDWKQTPPDYINALEPYWGTHRTFMIDSASQFTFDAPPEYNLTKDAVYRNYLDSLYTLTSNLNETQKEIATFWDDNPNVSTHQGHITVQNQKMTPGGHWLAIAQDIIIKKNKTFAEAAKAFALTSIAIQDALIATWHAKYFYNTVRPVTVILENISEEWDPYLQTPPFPEYPSGHSTLSGAASSVLIALWGDTIAFTDSSEFEYGLPVRSFDSFTQAANEVSISRVYGGIHYQFACDNGLKNGRRIGDFIVKKHKQQ
ncbi:MAG: vanadium-dependent haloperoxidase [Bacteroidetes bacterium]|nr:vanadium-dependent haloperoxidase [Bacteroidota bacterium]